MIGTRKGSRYAPKAALGPDYISYDSDPVLFVCEFSLNLYPVVMGSLGIGSTCEELASQGQPTY